MSLIQFTENYNPRTDKYDLGYIHEFYAKFFEPRQQSTTSLLEIGIWNGFSLRLWKDYFVNANVVGIDVNRCVDIENIKRIIPLYTDAYSMSFVNSIAPNSFDIIIDDGPHTFESMVFFLLYYLDKVRPGGLLILEDIVNPNWTPMLLKMIPLDVGQISVFDMRGKQLNSHLKNLWQNGLDVIVVEKY